MSWLDKDAMRFRDRSQIMTLRANVLMKQNVDALLRARGLKRKDLADYCRKGESWISKIMKEDRREFPMKYWDRISDFLRVETYQLLQPGLTPPTDRRKAQRRSGNDRRQAQVQQEVRAQLAQLPITDADVALLMRLKLLNEDDRALAVESLNALPRRRRGSKRLGTSGGGES